MLDWDDFRFVVALHRERSLKDAARMLGMDQATVGRRVYALEERLGVELFEKRSDGFYLTTAGQRILPTIEAIEDSFHSIDRKLSGEDDRVAGRVRIAAPGALANHLLIPRLGPLIEKHPELEVEFLTGPEVLNLARREADIALRLVRPAQRELVIRKIGELELALYASSELLERSGGAPRDLRALARLPFIGLYPEATSDVEARLLERMGEAAARPRLRSAAWQAVYSAVSAGLGMGILPSFVARSEPALKKLSIIEPSRMTLWLVVHPDIQASARVQAVIRHLSKSLLTTSSAV